MMMIVAPDSLVRRKEGAQGEKKAEEVGRRKAGSIVTPDARRGRSDRSNSVRTLRGVGCEEQEKHARWCGAPIHRMGRGG